MRLLFLGDVMGRSGRTAVAAELPRLRREWSLDFVVVNGENASQGAGITGDHAKELLAAGAPVSFHWVADRQSERRGEERERRGRSEEWSGRSGDARVADAAGDDA